MTRPPPDWQVYLGVRSVRRTPEEVTALLGLSPTTSSSKSGRRWPHLWRASFDATPEATLDEHLEALVDSCGGRIPQIRTLSAEPETAVMIQAVLRFRAADGLPSIWLPPRVVAFAAACHLGFDIDGYLQDQPESPPRPLSEEP